MPTSSEILYPHPGATSRSDQYWRTTCHCLRSDGASIAQGSTPCPTTGARRRQLSPTDQNATRREKFQADPPRQRPQRREVLALHGEGPVQLGARPGVI